MSNFNYNFRAPSLPVPTFDYSQKQQDQFQNALRLYFNRVDDFLFTLSTPAGGSGVAFPHIAASDSTDQYAGGNNTPTVVAWNTLDSGKGWTLNAPGSATADYGGIYTIRYSVQLANSANAIHNAVFWLKINSGSGLVDVPNSATIFTVPARKSAGNPAFVCGYSEVTFEVAAGDEIELWWATDLAYNPVGPIDGIYLHHEPAWTTPANPYVRPAVPSIVGSITFVSAV